MFAADLAKSFQVIPGRLEEANPEISAQPDQVVAMSGKTASILVFSVAALNGLTM